MELSRPTWVTAALLGLIAASLTACGSIKPEYAEILIETNPPGAACTVMRLDQPVASVNPTPGIVNLDPAATVGLSVACKRPGYADVALAIPPNKVTSSWGSSYPEPQQVQIPLMPAGPIALRR